MPFISIKNHISFAIIMSDSKRIVKNTIYLYVKTIVSLLVGVFTTRFLLEGLGESDFGLYNVVGGSISMLGFINASMSGVTQRFISYAEGKGDKKNVIKIFNNALLIHNVLALISVGILLIAGLFFFNGVLNIPDGKETDAICIYGCLLFSTSFSITVVPFEAEINAHEEMFVYAILGIADVVLKFLIALSVLYIKTDKLVLYAVLMASESLLIRLLTQIYCKRKYEECKKTRIRQNYEKNLVKEMISFSGWNLLNVGTGMISLFGMNIVVNHYFGVGVNAAMGVATQLSGVIMGMSMNMIKAVTPAIVKSEGGHQRDKMLSLSLSSCKFSFLLFSFFGIPIIFYIKPILELWLKEVPNWASVFCVILIASSLIEQLSVVLYQTIMAEGRVKNYNIWRSITNLTPIIISIIMFAKLNIAPYWILINWLVWKSFGGGIVNVIYTKINLGLKIRDFLNAVIRPTLLVCVSSIAIFSCIRMVGNMIDMNWLIPFALSGVFSIPIYYMLGLSNDEKSNLLKFIRI